MKLKVKVAGESESLTHASLSVCLTVCVCVCVRVWCLLSTARIVKALYDFQPMQQDDLAFSKGDIMKVDLSDDTSVQYMMHTILII